MIVKELIHYGTEELKKGGQSHCDADITLLLGACLNMSRTQLYLAANDEVATDVVARFKDYIERRKQREPVAYILGEREFWSKKFIVDENVLIPRPETEFLIECALRSQEQHAGKDGAILDLCCGSGVIAVILALELNRRVVAIDLSAGALAVARQNSRLHGVDHLIDFIRADLLSALLPLAQFSLVVSNPPYVSRHDMETTLEEDVVAYEPHMALDGGPRGLDCIVRIDEALPHLLCAGGELFMEIGADQGASVARLFRECAVAAEQIYADVDIVQDYAGRDRVLHARKK